MAGLQKDKGKLKARERNPASWVVWVRRAIQKRSRWSALVHGDGKLFIEKWGSLNLKDLTRQRQFAQKVMGRGRRHLRRPGWQRVEKTRFQTAKGVGTAPERHYIKARGVCKTSGGPKTLAGKVPNHGKRVYKKKCQVLNPRKTGLPGTRGNPGRTFNGTW